MVDSVSVSVGIQYLVLDSVTISAGIQLQSVYYSLDVVLLLVSRTITSQGTNNAYLGRCLAVRLSMVRAAYALVGGMVLAGCVS